MSQELIGPQNKKTLLNIKETMLKETMQKLKQARLEAGLDQKQVAEKLGITQSYISKIESGQRRIDLIQIKEFARIYKKKIFYFIQESNK